ncbi:hypothetical protein PTSG_07755 [Salpingoeca rosetta]|uniref:Uncharacterized protein n=1 Tax=Salpingoeca rosetta (strain ATCC 50818 / BSB-021) TaxID=946362 RepID=F2UG88_SALR5|nr:uncharacterized protein PTSG_07755 [Salpingoeca rosetta]EGD75638.1 hypothetical protein PTSG_07755 [Salpingoeca rosetta]|eukprot:XP_004991559.1 hypothetical protein PTSG_07755 [Salpingoeca rosetta]
MPQCMAWSIEVVCSGADDDGQWRTRKATTATTTETKLVPSLVPAILDAFSDLKYEHDVDDVGGGVVDDAVYLRVAPARLRQICDHVLGQLGSHSPECLPIVIKFRMQQGGGGTVEGGEEWEMMPQCVAAANSRRPRPSQSPPSTCLCCCCFTKHQNAHCRGAETTVIKLASTGRLTAAMAAATFARHTRAFLMCFKSIVHMIDILNRQQEAACRHLASTAGGGWGAGGAHWHGAGTGGGRSHARAAMSLATGHLKLLHPIALMLNGILDCLSNLHFIHIRQLFRRTAAAGLSIDDENEDELKRTGTIAAATVTRTLFALANDADISIDRDHLSSLLQALHFIYVDNTNNHQEQAHLSGCVHGDGGLTIDPPPPRPLGFRSLADPDVPDTHVVVSEKTLQAPFETKLQLLSGIAAEFAGTVHSKTDVETRLRKHAAETRTSSCS